jgi:predicted transport protein
MPLYSIADKKAVQIKSSKFISERELQRLFEANLESLLGVRFIASEFTTGDRQRGRIDSLGIDLDGTPTIIEYKKTINENIINQGLFYMDWLVDHKGDFTVAAQRVLGTNLKIEWGRPRLILIAEDFNEYDKYAVNRMGSNIELWCYRLYSNDLLFLDPIYTPEATRTRVTPTTKATLPVNEQLETGEETVEEEPLYDLDWHLGGKPDVIKELFENLRDQIFNIADENEIVEKVTKVYIGYRHGKNFCEIAPLKNDIKLWLDISLEELDDPKSLGRDVSRVGHHGTGKVELRIKDPSDVEYILGLIKQSYLLTV